MSQLTAMKCESCRGDAPVATEEEKAAFLSQLPDWHIELIDGEEQLKKVYTFKNFAQALAFTDQVGAAAEDQDHHPALLTEWGKVTVRWWTHKIRGLHRNDFIMASVTDALYNRRS